MVDHPQKKQNSGSQRVFDLQVHRAREILLAEMKGQRPALESTYIFTQTMRLVWKPRGSCKVSL